MSHDLFFDAIRERLLPDATDTEIESLFGQYLGAQPEPVFIAHIAGDPKPQGSKRYVGGGRVTRHTGVAAIRTTPTSRLPQPPTESPH